MEKLTKLYIILALIFITSAHAGKLVIRSQPDGADIFIMSDGSRPVLLGKTPYEGDLDVVINDYVKSSSFLLEIMKDGHDPYRVLLAKTANVDMALTAKLEISKNITNIKEHDLLMNELFDVQKLIRSRNFGDAIKKLEKLEDKNPRVSIIPELREQLCILIKMSRVL